MEVRTSRSDSKRTLRALRLTDGATIRMRTEALELQERVKDSIAILRYAGTAMKAGGMITCHHITCSQWQMLLFPSNQSVSTILTMRTDTI